MCVLVNMSSETLLEGFAHAFSQSAPMDSFSQDVVTMETEEIG